MNKQLASTILTLSMLTGCVSHQDLMPTPIPTLREPQKMTLDQAIQTCVTSELLGTRGSIPTVQEALANKAALISMGRMWLRNNEHESGGSNSEYLLGWVEYDSLILIEPKEGDLGTLVCSYINVDHHNKLEEI